MKPCRWLHVWCLILLCVIFHTPYGLAQVEEDAPTRGTTRPETGPRTILIVGDALAQGLAQGLAARLQQNPETTLSGRFQEDSGLVRRDVYDWTTALPKIIARDPADLVIAMIGANDAQTLEVNPVLYLFGTEGWKAAYRDRLKDFVRVIRASGAKLYWIGPPPMGDDDYSERIRLVAEIQAQTMQDLGVEYLDLRKALNDPEGPIDGIQISDPPVRIRNRDGVTFSREGNLRLAELVLARLEAASASKGAENRIVTPSPVTPQFEDTKVSLPLFGQEPAPDVVNVVVAEAEKKPAQTIPASVKKSEQLFIRGLMPLAPPGRFDDFAIPVSKKPPGP